MSPEFIQGIIVFVLAAFIGFEVISKVPPTLHTPLMSGANAISGITIVGAIIAAAFAEGTVASHPRHPRDGLCHDQRRGRVPRNGPNA